MAHDSTTNIRLGTSSFVGGGPGPSPPARRNAQYPEVTLRRRLLVVFSLMAIVSVGVNVLFILGMQVSSEPGAHSEIEHTTLNAGTSPLGSGKGLETTARYRSNLLILLGVTAVCFGTIIYLFVKRFFVPVDKIAKSAQEISVGNLSVTAPSNTMDEIGRLGQAVNNIAANYQEVLLFSGTKLGTMSETVERLEKMVQEEPNLEDSEEYRAQLNALKSELDDLINVVKEFNYYQAEFDGKKVIAGS